MNNNDIINTGLSRLFTFINVDGRMLKKYSAESFPEVESSGAYIFTWFDHESVTVAIYKMLDVDSSGRHESLRTTLPVEYGYSITIDIYGEIVIDTHSHGRTSCPIVVDSGFFMKLPDHINESIMFDNLHSLSRDPEGLSIVLYTLRNYADIFGYDFRVSPKSGPDPSEDTPAKFEYSTTVTYDELEKMYSEIMSKAKNIFVSKNKDYATSDNALAGFINTANKAGITPLQVWSVFSSKHIAAIDAFVKGHSEESEPIEGRIADVINYMAFLYAMVKAVKK